MVEYKKNKNWIFLSNWLEKCDHLQKDYFSKVISHEMPAVLEYVFKCDEEEIKHGFFKIIKQMFTHLP